MQISLDPAPEATVQPELPSENKQSETGFAQIRAPQPGIAWFQWHSEQGTHIWAYPWHLGKTSNTKEVMGGMLAIC